MLAAIVIRLPCLDAAHDLSGESFIDFPGIQIVEPKIVALQDRGYRMHRAKAHLRGIKTGPLAVHNAANRLEVPLLHCFFGSQDQPGSTVGNLRTVSGSDVAVLLVEEGLQLGQPGHAGIGTNAVILGVDITLVVDQRHDFAEMASLAPCHRTLMAAHRKLVHLLTVDAEFPGQIFCGLAHQHAIDRVGQALHQANDRRQQNTGAQFHELLHLCACGACRHHLREPQHHRIGVEQRRARQRVYATRQHQLRTAGLDIGHGRIQCLHAAGAVAHHRPARHIKAAAQTQRDHAADIGFIRRRRCAAEDDLVQIARGKRLPRQQRTPGLYRQVARRKRTGSIAGLEERRPRSIHYIHRFECHLVFSFGQFCLV